MIALSNETVDRIVSAFASLLDPRLALLADNSYPQICTPLAGARYPEGTQNITGTIASDFTGYHSVNLINAAGTTVGMVVINVQATATAHPFPGQGIFTQYLPTGSYTLRVSRLDNLYIDHPHSIRVVIY